jgi:Uri superfamily endonuclease
MDKGIYCLVFRNPGCTVTIGALGEITFRRGWHLYIGSALGSGGLARLRRHITLAELKDKCPKWHVDFLLTSNQFTLRYTIAAITTEPLECSLAGAIGSDTVPGFGCSDCNCTSHLFFRRTDPVARVEHAFQAIGLVPATTLMSRERSKG